MNNKEYKNFYLWTLGAILFIFIYGGLQLVIDNHPALQTLKVHYPLQAHVALAALSFFLSIVVSYSSQFWVRFFRLDQKQKLVTRFVYLLCFLLIGIGLAIIGAAFWAFG